MKIRISMPGAYMVMDMEEAQSGVRLRNHSNPLRKSSRMRRSAAKMKTKKKQRKQKTNPQMWIYFGGCMTKKDLNGYRTKKRWV